MSPDHCCMCEPSKCEDKCGSYMGYMGSGSQGAYTPDFHNMKIKSDRKEMDRLERIEKKLDEILKKLK